MQRVKYLEDIVFDKHYCNKTLIQVRLNLLKYNGQCAYLGCWTGLYTNSPAKQRLWRHMKLSITMIHSNST